MLHSKIDFFYFCVTILATVLQRVGEKMHRKLAIGGTFHKGTDLMQINPSHVVTTACITPLLPKETAGVSLELYTKTSYTVALLLQLGLKPWLGKMDLKVTSCKDPEDEKRRHFRSSLLCDVHMYEDLDEDGFQKWFGRIEASIYALHIYGVYDFELNYEIVKKLK